MAGSLLAIIALRGIFQVIESSQGWVHLPSGEPTAGKSGASLRSVSKSLRSLQVCPCPEGVAAASVIATSLFAVPSISYAGHPIGIRAALVMRAYPQLVGAISILAAGWCLQMAIPTGCSSFVRILLSGAFCTCFYLAIVVGFFGLPSRLRCGSVV